MGSARSAVSPRLVLLRHGQGSLGSADYDQLSPIGRRQAARLGEHLGELLSDAPSVWSGSLKRHRQTVESMTPATQPTIEARLNEYTVDRLIRAAIEQASALGLAAPPEQALADPVSYLKTFLDWFPEVLSAWQADRLRCNHNGRWSDFHARVLQPVDAWRARLQSGQNVVVVTSAGVISTIVSSLLERELVWQRELNVALYNASLTELALDAHGRWRVERLNSVDHLDRTLLTLA